MAIATLRSTVSAWPCSSKAITTTPAPYSRTFLALAKKSASPSFKLMELTMPLPCTHLRPASMTLHLLESTMIGMREISGSAAIRLRKRGHRGFAVEHALVHVDVEDVGAAAHLVERHVERALVVVGLDQVGELLGAGDVGALADHREVGLGRDGQRLESAEVRQRVIDRGQLARRQTLDTRSAMAGCASAWCRSSRPPR